MQKPIIKIENLSKKFDNVQLFENINLDIFPKQILGILGLSGSGKSTLLNILCGFLKPTTGNILFKVEDDKKEYLPVYDSNKKIKSQIGFAAQNPSFYEDLSVYDNLKYFGILKNVNKKTIDMKIDDLLKIFDLVNAKKTIAKNLSEGMKKRLDFACAIIHEPSLLVLDEPTSNLDFKLREEIMNYVKKINETGVAIILVTHFLSEIENICTDVLMLGNNKYELVSPKDIRKKFEKFSDIEVKKNE